MKLVFLLPLLCALNAQARRKPVTLEAVAAAPASQPLALAWPADGRSFAWEESRKLWIHEISPARKRELFSFADLESKATPGQKPELFDWQNRHVSEQTFRWFRSSRRLLVSAGGDLFLVDGETGKPDQLTSTPEAERDPKLSPDDRFVSFRRGHDLYCLEIATRKVTRLTHDGSATLWSGELDWVYPEELEIGTAHWWSPDSKRIAFLQFDVSREPVFPQVDLTAVRAKLEPERYPQAGDPNADVRVGVVSAQGGPARWMDLGETRDALIARVQWLPNGREIAVERLNRIQNRLDLMLANVETGNARVLLHEEDPYWININDVFRFADNGRRFLWGSERDGFLHLYLYSAEGKLLSQLTRGDWEVTEVAGVNEKVYYVSTEQSPLERQLYSIGLDGNGKRRITSAKGSHEISMSPGCEFFVDRASSLTAPPRETVHRSDGTQAGVFRDAAAQEYDLQNPEIVSFKAPDGTLLYGRLTRPAGFAPGRKYPVVVSLYGGPRTQVVQDAWPGLSFNQLLAARGFLVWEMDNRGSFGRGHKWEAAIFRNFGERELEDQKAGIHYLESLGFADTSRMAIHGFSYGGFMTLNALLRAPDLFRAGIAGAPVTDWRNYDSIYTERYMGMPDDNAEAYRRCSPVYAAGNLKSRLMIIHNIEDDNVHFQNTLRMAAALETAGKPFELFLYPLKEHHITGAARRHFHEKMLKFLESALCPPC